MKLTVLYNYGTKLKLVSEDATDHQIIETMNTIDWNKFTQVVLEQNNGDHIEVGGSLGSDGLSVMYSERQRQYFIVRPPDSVVEMTRILLSYHSGDGIYKEENKFE